MARRFVNGRTGRERYCLRIRDVADVDWLENDIADRIMSAIVNQAKDYEMVTETTHKGKRSVARFAPTFAIAAVTAAITAGLTVLSASTGGFAAYSQTDSGNAVDSRWTWPIVVHLFTALPSLVLGAFILWRKKGGALHRILGRTYSMLMLATAVTSFWIGRPGTGIAGSGYSFIHIFSVWTLFCVPWAVWAARKGNIAKHQSIMRGLYIGLCIAGAFTLIPGRLLGDLVF